MVAGAEKNHLRDKEDLHENIVFAKGSTRPNDQKGARKKPKRGESEEKGRDGASPPKKPDNRTSVKKGPQDLQEWEKVGERGESLRGGEEIPSSRVPSP